MMHADAIHIFCSSLNHAIAHQVAMHTIALGIISQQELHPAGPEQQGTRHTEHGLFGITLHEYAPDGNHQSHETHGKGRIMQGGRLHGMLHDNHQRMAQRHQQQDNQYRPYGHSQVFCLHHVLFLFITTYYYLYCLLLFQIGLQRYNYLDFFAIPRNNDLISLGLSP